MIRPRCAAALRCARALALAMLLWGATVPRLVAVDELLAWDDFESYPSGTISTTAGSSFAGGDGWVASGGEVGWEVSSAGQQATLTTPGLIAGSQACLNTVGRGVVERVLLPLTPTAAQPLWVSFVLQGSNLTAVATQVTQPQNLIGFYDGPLTSGVFTINTLGSRVDGSSSLSEPIRWRLGTVDQAASTQLEVDNNAHLVVVELTTSQVSLWIFSSATPSASTIASTPAMDTLALAGSTTIDRISFQADIFTGISASLAIDNLCFGTSETAVTASGMPHVFALSPAAGVVTGGDALTIAGSGFDATSQVLLGGTPATAIAQSGGTALSCLTPGSLSGLGIVDVVVSNSVGSVLHPQSFTYQAASAADPSSTAPPAIDHGAGTGPGSAWLGSSGSWSPTPTGFSYAWQTSVDGSIVDATPINGATGSTYTVASGDVGNFIRLAVTPAGTNHVAFSAFVQVTILKGSGSSSTGSGTGTAAAGSVTSGTAGSSCGLGAGAGIILPGLLWLAQRRRRLLAAHAR